MRKWTMILALLLLASCAPAKKAEVILPGSSMEDVLAQIYEKKDPGLMVGEIPADLANPEWVKVYTGLDKGDALQDISVSETMIGAQAYSLVLLRVKDPAQSQETAREMLRGIDPRKWICVAADDVRVVVRGDLVLLFMVSTEFEDTVRSEEIIAAFQETTGGKLDLELKK